MHAELNPSSSVTAVFPCCHWMFLTSSPFKVAMAVKTLVSHYNSRCFRAALYKYHVTGTALYVLPLGMTSEGNGAFAFSVMKLML